MAHAMKSHVSGNTNIFGSPGTRARIIGLLISLWPLLLIAFAAGYLTRSALPFPELNLPLTGVGFLILAVLFAAAVNHSRNHLKRYFKGAHGEETVALILNRLPSPCAIFHSVAGITRSGHDIDHLVLTPSALFLLETKCWTGTISLDHDQTLLLDQIPPDRDPLEQICRECDDLKGWLDHPPPPVIPVLVFVGTQFDQIPEQQRGVMICQEHELYDKLLRINQNMPEALDENDDQALIKRLRQQIETEQQE